jgi:hypothetical protein
MRALLLALLPLTALAPGGDPPPGTFELSPRPVGWQVLQARHYDLRWCLPAARTDGGSDLTRDLRGLLATELALELPAGLARPGETTALTTFGDLAAWVGTRPLAERRALVEACLASRPEVAALHGEAVLQLLDDSRLLGSRWDPDEDEDDDGLLEGSAWELPTEAAPWDEIGVDVIAEQGAVFVRSDLTSFKEVENDYSVYGDDVGEGYESIGPVRGSLVEGVDPDGRPFAAYRVAFEQDLPFPFGGYDCDLRVLNRMTAAGELEAHIYAEADDFHWIAGRDAFLPVRTSAGEAVGLLVVRVYGFDLDGVPDGRKHRRAALRGSLGNLKRKAEARYAELGPRDVPGELPVPPLRGRL